MKNILQDDRGFTLIELLVSMVILGIVLTGLLNLLSNSTNMFNKQNDEVYNQQNLRETINKVSEYVLQGTTTKVYNNTDFGVDGTYRIYLNANKIYVKDLVKGGIPTPISTDIKTFNVLSVIEGRTIKLTLVDKTGEFTLDTILTPRNY